jgi:hypothetical protein
VEARSFLVEHRLSGRELRPVDGHGSMRPNSTVTMKVTLAVPRDGFQDAQSVSKSASAPTRRSGTGWSATSRFKLPTAATGPTSAAAIAEAPGAPVLRCHVVGAILEVT